jgi:TatA/E family protein of Tat protein translocase
MEGLLQPTHLILILVIALLVFGPRKLPELVQGRAERGQRRLWQRGTPGTSTLARDIKIPKHAR